MPQGITRSSIEGFDKVIKNLNIEIMAMKDVKVRRALIKCSIFIHDDMENNDVATIPVLKTFLQKSWQTFPEREGNFFGLRMGFSSNYALWVHEMYGATKWTREGSGAGFFIKSLNRNHDELLQIIAAETRKPI